MTQTLQPIAAPTARAGLSGDAGIAVIASVFVAFLAASSAPTPLYAIYQAEWGFSAITTTVVFGTYAVAVLLALLTLGRLSDHLGRRPVVLLAIAVQALAMVLFATANGVPALLVARIVQGVATGAAVAAGGAWMLDLNRAKGTLANAAAPGFGTAFGAVIASVVVATLPAPTHLIFVAILVILAVQAAAVARIPETSPREPGALASARPHLELPRHVRRPAVIALPVMFAVWALAGFYGSLGPAVIGELVGSTSVAFAGLGLFVLATVGASSVLVLRNAPARSVMMLGILALITGIAVVLTSLAVLSPVLFFVGTAVAGIGFGAGFQGGIRLVIPQALPDERAGVLSLLYVVSYLGLGVPAVLAGVLVVHSGNLLTTARDYGIFVIALALVALAGLVLPRRTLDRSV
ncbi:MFS transporter [Cellulomonas sp. URHD0024]|uniref:MFS transporter n=1 Tax=Cellulomonas sp. URHD0024 TaxID=1302620 RepID=UPI00041527F9|nr:MFS transporter [Cellulomonas sp. URHD0024]